MRTTLRRWRLATVVGAIVLATACGGSGAGGGVGETIVYGGSTWLGHYPAMVGVKKDFFADAGLDVKFQSFDTSSARMTAMAAGDVDFASTGSVSAISLMAQGNDSFYVIGTQDKYVHQEGIVARKGIKTVADLKGKKVGTTFASSSHAMVLSLLEQAGLQPGKDVQLVDMSGPDMLQPFRAGQIDAAAIWQPTFAELQNVPGAHVIADPTDTAFFKKYGFAPGPDVLVIARDFVDNQPKRASRLVDAYFEALTWMKKHPDKALPIITSYTKLPRKEQQRYLRDVEWIDQTTQQRYMAPDGPFIRSLEDLAKLMEEDGLIPTAPTVRDWINTDVLR